MNKRFLKYGIIAASFACSVILIGYKYNNIENPINKINEVKARMSEIGKDKEGTLIAEGGYFTPCLNHEGNKLLYSSGDDIYEMDLEKNHIKRLTTMGNCYNPVYFQKDNNVIAFARNNGIYTMNISKNEINKVIVSSDSQISFAKPSFTPEGDIIYFKVAVIPEPSGHGFIEKDPAVYMLNVKNNKEEKLLEGYNPLVSKDGKSLLYESKDNIYLMNLQTRESKFIDSGKYTSWSNSGKYISYTKFERSSTNYKKLKGKNNFFIDKEFSNVYVASLDNLKNKYRITKEEFENRDKLVDSWVNDVKDSTAEQHFLIVSKMAYFDSVFSKDDKKLYISAYNCDKGNFELLEYKLSNR